MEKLKLISKSDDELIYVVEDGDNLRSIAENFSTTENLIIADNFLKNKVKTGDVLYVKKYSNIYVVKPSDTIESIAKNFQVNELDVLNINKITYIYVGERIVIP